MPSLMSLSEHSPQQGLSEWCNSHKQILSLKNGVGGKNEEKLLGLMNIFYLRGVFFLVRSISGGVAWFHFAMLHSPSIEVNCGNLYVLEFYEFAEEALDWKPHTKFWLTVSKSSADFRGLSLDM